MIRMISVIAFVLGAIVVVWMASAFVGSNALALGVTLLIAAAYMVGFAELVRYQQASLVLSKALSGVDDSLQDLESWLAGIPITLRNAVRQRIQGEYVGLPGPILSPYIIGLLVMLGLLGTFIGMVVTLKGAVVALEGTNELEAVRAGLAAPIKGLGMAFATSVAGVSASAMLGLISTVSRRERLQISRQLDTSMSTVFKPFSLSQQRRQSYQAMQSQAEALPAVAEQLAVLADRLGQMGDDLASTLTRSQEQFHVATQKQYTELARSVDGSLKQSLADSGRLAGENIAPVVSAFVSDIRDDLKSSQQHLQATAEAHLKRLDARYVNTSDDFNRAWQQAVNAQQAGSESLLATMDQRFAQLADQFENSSQSLVHSFNSVSEDWVATQQSAEQKRLANWSVVFDQSADLLRSSAETLTINARAGSQALATEFTKLLSASEELVAARTRSESHWLDSYQQRMGDMTATIKSEMQALVHSFNSVSEDWVATQQSAEQERLASWSMAFDQSADLLRSSAETLTINARDGSQALTIEFTKLLSASEELVAARTRSESHWLDSYQQRMGDMTATIKSELQSLQVLEEQRGEAAVNRLTDLQAAVAEHLASLAHVIEEPMGRLIESASETPRIAAEIMSKLREEMNENIERDNSLLDERRELMMQLSGLSESLQMSALGQREAVESILANSSGLLADISQRFGDSVEKQSSKLSDIVVHFEGGSAELASLGDAFASAVSEFSDANGGLIATLLKVEAGLQGSGERSDEQMAYYVAQAREIIDHNMLSHQEIITQLQTLSSHAAVAQEDVPA
jgi:hypothetical protein